MKVPAFGSKAHLAALKEMREAQQSRCPGRHHRRHVLAVCAGSCCSACGGPIDDDSECRCGGGQ